MPLSRGTPGRGRGSAGRGGFGHHGPWADGERPSDRSPSASSSGLAATLTPWPRGRAGGGPQRGRSPIPSARSRPRRPGRSTFYSDAECHVRREVVDALHDTGKRLTPMAVADLIGAVWGLMRAAQRGEICDAADLVPVRSAPTLWELRWDFRKAGEYWMYHAEPLTGPDLVALRFHRKDTTPGTQDAIDAQQDREMAKAGKRYGDGKDRLWGHRRRCRDCLDPEVNI